MRRYCGEVSPGGTGRIWRRTAAGRARLHRAGVGARPSAGRRWMLATLTGLTAGLLAAGCGTAAPGTFRPAGAAGPAHRGTGPAPGGPGGAGPAAATAGTGPAGAAAVRLSWPPFGRDVHIVMPGWRPPDGAVAPAVITAEDFLLAVLYAEYRGNQDDRWTAYAAGRARTVQQSILAQPGVTAESFTGTIIFSHISAFPDPTLSGAVDVSECFDNAKSANTSLGTGQVIPDHGPASQHYYRNTDVVADRNGRWQVVSMYPVIYYPQAAECGP